MSQLEKLFNKSDKDFSKIINYDTRKKSSKTSESVCTQCGSRSRNIPTASIAEIALGLKPLITGGTTSTTGTSNTCSANPTKTCTLNK